MRRIVTAMQSACHDKYRTLHLPGMGDGVSGRSRVGWRSFKSAMEGLSTNVNSVLFGKRSRICRKHLHTLSMGLTLSMITVSTRLRANLHSSSGLAVMAGDRKENAAMLRRSELTGTLYAHSRPIYHFPQTHALTLPKTKITPTQRTVDGR